ncbi:MAG TPA: DUF305 domain-containing protein [Leptolyngbyaceae cyanobacterium M33_DOE_097]|uniref:DUF305 domain-containing protein n=1 Tax=Oscillatoriales cyanobacterium SpSt-418 TaxID=2282169 RepID=A0A7C3KI33_9CYAN|nr:DUF305 domain-containing protein [Leptolyngbyaceae cyanobacterium M33_DOE_097]
MRQKVFSYTLIGLLTSGVFTGLAIANTDRPSPPLLAQGYMRRGQVDQHFIEMMIPHHQDAVDMAELALTRATHPELKKLAQTIKQDQTREIQQMRAWYQAWYGTSVPVAFRGGGMMGRGMGMSGGMGCMMTVDLDSLKTSSDFDREFIQQMIPHHQMAVRMAQMLLYRTNRPEMQKLGNNIIRTQTAEINQMEQWYQTWYRPKSQN